MSQTQYTKAVVRPETVMCRRQTPQVEHVEVEGETVVYHCDHAQLHLLDPIATLIWRLMDGHATLRQTSEELAEVFGRSAEDTLTDVQTFAARLEEIDLVERVG